MPSPRNNQLHDRSPFTGHPVVRRKYVIRSVTGGWSLQYTDGAGQWERTENVIHATKKSARKEAQKQGARPK